MPYSRDDGGWMQRPTSDGWRTPIIEDAHHPANLGTEPDLYEAHFRSHFEGSHPRQRVSTSLHNVQEEMEIDQLADTEPKRLSWRQRMKHVTWAWFTMSMATGGIASVIFSGKSINTQTELRL